MSRGRHRFTKRETILWKEHTRDHPKGITTCGALSSVQGLNNGNATQVLSLASSTANNSRQLMRHCSHGPVQPILDAPATTTCLDTCSKGTPTHRKGRSDQGLKIWHQISVT